MDQYTDYCGIIKEACQPLFRYFPITHFRYAEVNENGSYMALSSNAAILQEYIRRGYLKETPVHLLLNYDVPGYYLDDFYSYENKQAEINYRQLLKDFSYGHSFSIVHQDQTLAGIVYKFYIFDADEKNKAINHLYLNHIDVFKKFTVHIDKKIARVKDEMVFNKVEPDKTKVLNALFYQANLSLAKVLGRKSKFLNNLEITEDFDKIPTTREMEILLWHLKGKNAAETSSILSISPRTVEKHFERLRKKLNCFSKSQIAVKIARLIDF